MTNPHRSTRRLALAPASLALAALLGCDREDPDVAAVKSAAITIQTLPGASLPSSPNPKVTTAYGKVVQELGTIGKEQGKTGAAASTLIASSQAGLAEVDASAYFAKEDEADAKASQIRRHLAAWVSRSAVAAAADSFNPASELERLAAALQEKHALKAKASADASALSGQVGDLRAAAREKHAQAEVKQAEFARLAASAAKLKATEGAPIMERAHAVKREADLLRQAGNELDAQADHITPRIEQLSLDVSLYESQSKNLETTATELRTQAELNTRAAAEARADAAAASRDLDAAVRDLDTFRSGAVTDAGEKALRTLKAAESAAKAASRDSKEQADLLIGAAQQSIGDIQWAKAVGASRWASLLESLAKASPALPNAADYTTKATAARSIESDAKKAAADAFDAAKAAFERAPAKGPAKERLKALAEEVAKRAALARGEAIDSQAAAPATPAADAPSKPAPAAPGAVDDALKSMLTAYCDALREGRYKDVAALVHTQNAELRAFVEASMELTGKSVALDEALRKKFNVGLSDALAKVPGAAMMLQGQMGGDITKMKSLTFDDLKVSVTGDSASITNPIHPRPMQAKKVDGQWKIVIPELALLGPQIGMAAKALPAMGKAMDDTTAEVNAGTHASADAAAQAFMQKIMAAMQQMMPPGGGTK